MHQDRLGTQTYRENLRQKGWVACFESFFFFCMQGARGEQHAIDRIPADEEPRYEGDERDGAYPTEEEEEEEEEEEKSRLNSTRLTFVCVHYIHEKRVHRLPRQARDNQTKTYKRNAF